MQTRNLENGDTRDMWKYVPYMMCSSKRDPKTGTTNDITFCMNGEQKAYEACEVFRKTGVTP